MTTRFGNANEHADWETAHHVFTYANALHQMLTRIGTANIDTHVTAVRGVLHGAMALYLARYLNVPPARIPGDAGEQLDDLAADPETIGAALLDAFDRQRQVDLAASLVARHLTLGHSPQALIATLAHAVLREDAGFHAYQMLEAGVRQFAAWGDTDEGRRARLVVRSADQFMRRALVARINRARSPRRSPPKRSKRRAFGRDTPRDCKCQPRQTVLPRAQEPPR